MAVAVAVAIGVGLAVATQASILGQASRSIHPLNVSLALQVAGVLIGLVWVAYARAWSGVMEAIGHWWWLPLGLVGLVVVAAIGFSSARLGVVTTLALVIAAQLTAGLVLDLVSGVASFDLRQLAGILVVLAGVLILSSRPVPQL